jgi:hypothetical protein
VIGSAFIREIRRKSAELIGAELREIQMENPPRKRRERGRLELRGKVQAGIHLLGPGHLRIAPYVHSGLAQGPRVAVTVRERHRPRYEHVGTTIGPIERLLFKSARGRRFVRSFDRWRGAAALPDDAMNGGAEYWSAGRSVGGIHGVESARTVVRRFAAAISEPAHVGRPAIAPPAQRSPLSLP